MRSLFGMLLVVAAMLAATSYSQIDTTKSFNTTDGVMISNTTNGDLIWLGGGEIDPTILPGIAAPLGSSYTRTNNNRYQKTGPLATDWTLEGLGSAVVTQTADFGTSGNASANSYLDRAGGVSSNISGIPIMVSAGKIKSISCGSENIETYSVEVYEHEGDFINPVLLYTLSVVASRSGSVHGLDVSVTQDSQLATKVLNSVKNIGCTIGLKGLSL